MYKKKKKKKRHSAFCSLAVHNLNSTFRVKCCEKPLAAVINSLVKIGFAKKRIDQHTLKNQILLAQNIPNDFILQGACYLTYVMCHFCQL